MNARKKFHLAPNIDDVDDSTDWMEIVNIVEDKEKHQLSFIEEIESLTRKEPKKSVFKILLGPIPEDTHEQYWKVLYEIKEEALKILFGHNYIKSYQVISEDIKKDLDEPPTNYLLVNLRINRNKIAELESVKAKIQSIYENKKNLYSVKPKVFFDAASGIFSCNGRNGKLKVGTKDYRIFKRLYENIGKRIARDKILECAHIYEEWEDIPKANKKRDTYAINEIAKSLRKKTRLTTKELVLNDGNLTLRAERIDETPQT